MSERLKIYCVTHQPLKIIDELGFIPFGAGTGNYPNHYIHDSTKDNIAEKNKYFGSLTFHYWIWKNVIQNYDDNWIGICQYRRFFIKPTYRDNLDSVSRKSNKALTVESLKDIIQNTVSDAWKNHDAILCDPYDLTKIKFSKLLKRGFRSIISNPSILFSNKHRSIKLHFDMHHGYGNLEKAIDVMNPKDRDDFKKFCKTQNKMSAHDSFFIKPQILKELYENLFPWIFECEKIFGTDLKGYDLSRIYIYLAERFIPFWLDKYYKVLPWPFIFYDTK